jgi:hypothetical protein
MAWAGAGVVGVEVGVELEGACLVGMSSSEVLKPGMYKLVDEKGVVFTNAWNIEQLRHFYP